MNKIAFVIPVFNRLDYNKECLRILDKQRDTSLFVKNEIVIIVVDDGSSDGTGDWIRENHPEVIVLQGDGNLWYAGSMNLGMRYAFETLDSDFIMVWENDIFPLDNNYFNNLQVILDKWDGKSTICSRLYYRIQPEIIFGIGGIFNFKTGKKGLIGRGDRDTPENSRDMEVDWFLGQGVLIHRDLVENVGYFDNINFPQYSADVDYGVRMKKGGYKNIVYYELKLLNDTETTGLSHQINKTLGQFFTSLFSIRSATNIRRDINFYRIHTTSIFAYRMVVKKYFIYTGSFVKWGVLGWFGIRRKNEELF